MNSSIKELDRITKNLEGDLNRSRLDKLVRETVVIKHDSEPDKEVVVERVVDTPSSDATEMKFDAIPLEQLKGDIARAGHPVKQALALDADGRRLFFTDKDGQHLFAEFGEPQEGFRVKRIAHQASIAKEYSVIDLEPSTESGNMGETVETVHTEEESQDEPGFHPGGTPTVKPEDDDRGFAADKMSLIREMKDYLEDEECK